MDTTTIRVGEAREILALVPHQLGFRPADSVVGVSLRPPRGRVGLVVRVDLPAVADPRDGPRVARGLVAHLGGDGADRAMLVVYTDVDPRTDAAAPVHAAARHVREAAATVLDDVVVWVVTRTGFLALDCDQGCCPPGGRSLRELESTQVGAQMVLAGSVVLDSREDLARIVPAGGEARRGTARMCRRWTARRETAAGDAAALARWRADSVATWRAECAAVRTGPAAAGVRSRLGRLEAGLADRRVRDAVLVSFVPGTGDLAERSVATAALGPVLDAQVGRAVGAIVGAGSAVRPDVDAVAVQVAVLERVVAHGARARQSPALTLLGLLAWWSGDGARARALIERALEDDPSYRLAAMLADVLDAAIAPGWVRRDA